MIGQTILPIAIGLLSMAIKHNKKAQIAGFLAMSGAGVGFSLGSVALQARFCLPEEMKAISVTMSLFVCSSLIAYPILDIQPILSIVPHRGRNDRSLPTRCSA